ncbi:MAG TPA: IS66 family insertion sequence element accessory protein TnpB [Candidatus Eisenbergiella merdipullorum]|uniref:IS66 family insertion sequence element accessory protein TnpB n=1 Tax=Candidatus Eisenbergiella merdipullorum TaxID=2838553 RepID=A0A9D2I8X9_9FIRM|nr:IS66 family insertion sequence element accessory protein TnpB [Candidatus Eisenbergiella merdipullorum]
MDKITHQVRAEHWAKIMNECINSGMSKTAWCRANGISEKQFFCWQRILRREAFENSQNSSLPAIIGSDQEMVPTTQGTVSFTEIKIPSSSQSTASVFHPDLVIRKGDIIMEISNSASDALLSRIGGILSAA